MKKKSQLVYIEWYDTVNGNPEWVTKEQAIEWAKTGEWIVKQSGWIIEDTKDYLLLGLGIREGDSFSATRYLGAIQIPKGCIRKLKEITSF